MDRVEQFEHTRAICYFVAMAYMGENKQTMQDFWSLPTDDTPLVKEEEQRLYMRRVMYAYEHGIELDQVPENFN